MLPAVGLDSSQWNDTPIQPRLLLTRLRGAEPRWQAKDEVTAMGEKLFGGAAQK
jgi:hypothetical protein